MLQHALASKRQSHRVLWAFQSSPVFVAKFLEAVINDPTHRKRLREMVQRREDVAVDLVGALIGNPGRVKAIAKLASGHQRFIDQLLAALGPSLGAGPVRATIMGHCLAALTDDLVADPARLEAFLRELAVKSGLPPQAIVDRVLQDPEVAAAVLEALSGSWAGDLDALLAEHPDALHGLLVRWQDNPALEPALIDAVTQDPHFAAQLGCRVVERLSDDAAPAEDLDRFAAAAVQSRKVVRQVLDQPGFKDEVEVLSRQGRSERPHHLRQPELLRVLVPPVLSEGAAEKKNGLLKAAQNAVEAATLWYALRPYLAMQDPKLAGGLERLLHSVAKTQNVWKSLLSIICVDQKLLLDPLRFGYASAGDLPTLIREILLEEHYYFECGRPDPYIVDAGVNCGLGLYYFKRLYPQARIVGFEPVPEMWQLAQDNVARAGWSDVTLHQVAISDQDGTATCYTSKQSSLAGSLMDRMREKGHSLDAITVKTERLRSYLLDHVDYLKLDIEGSEDVVLADCADLLANVDNIFCEFHFGANLAADRLVRILNILELAGFKVRVDQSLFGRKVGATRPLSSICHDASLSIWGTRIDG